MQAYTELVQDARVVVIQIPVSITVHAMKVTIVTLVTAGGLLSKDPFVLMVIISIFFSFLYLFIILTLFFSYRNWCEHET